MSWIRIGRLMRRRTLQPTEDELDLDREIEYAFEAEDTMAGRSPAGDVE